MKSSQDEVGIEAVRLFFQTTISEVSNNLPSNIVSLESISDQTLFDKSKEYFLSKLKESQSSLEKTKVNIMINEYIQKNSSDRRNERMKLEDELYPLKFVLMKRFKAPEDLESKTLGEIEITLHPYKFNELESRVLSEVFKIKPPVVQQIRTNLGHGYDLLTETVKDKLVIHLESEVAVPPYGFLIPANCQSHFASLDDINFICDFFCNLDEYNVTRLADLDLMDYKGDIRFNPLHGHNIYDPNSTSTSRKVEITFVVEKVLSSINIRLNSYQLADNFQDILKDLPKSFDKNDEANAQKFDDFFTQHGCFFLSGVSIGGYVCGKFRVNCERLTPDYFDYLRQRLVNIILNIKYGVSKEEFLKQTKEIEKEMLNPFYDLLSAELEWFGGDPKYYQKTFKDLSQVEWRSWERSVNSRPVILPHHLCLQPIFHVTKSHDNAILEAFKEHLLKLKKLHEQSPHRSLRLVEKSLMTQRSANRAVFFLYGLSGSGKTATLMHLFNGAKELQISSKESATRSVIEHIYPLKSDHWGISNLQISFVDCPGFGNTDGLNQDAINLALIEEFIKQHPQLGAQGIKWLGCPYHYPVYPNIVMIVIDVNDERMLGYQSRVASMFKVLKKKKLHLIDRKRANVVIVLTHVCCLLKKNWAARLDSKAHFVQLIARKFLKMQVPVVYIENDFDSFDLEEKGDFSILYNGEYQPKNLFDACIDIMKSSQDEVGIEAVRLFFQTTISEVSNNLPSNIVSLESISDQTLFDKSKEYFLSKLKESQSSLEKTKVNIMINEYIQKNSSDPRNEGMRLEDELYPLQYVLMKRFKRPEDLESKTLGEIEIGLHPYKLNELESRVLSEVFKIKPPVVQQIRTNLGHGYDLLTETVKDKLVIHLESEVAVPPYGFLIPANCECQFTGVNNCDFNFICDFFSNLEYNEARLAELDLKDCSGVIRFKPLQGHNIFDHSSTSNPKKVEITFAYQKVLGYISIAPNRYQLARRFQDLLKDIPESFDEDNKATVQKFDELFAQYGCFFLSEVSIGGYVCGKFSVNRERLTPDYCSYLKSCLANIILNIKHGVSKEEFLQQINEMEKEMLNPFHDLQSAELEWFGGDPKYYQKTFKDLSQRQWQSWEESVNYKPVILPHNIDLKPIFHVTKSHDNAIQEAFKKHLLKLKPSQSKPKLFTKAWFSNRHTRKAESERVKTEIKNTSRSFCFSGNSTVRLSTGQIIAMENVHIGDKVLSVNSEGRPCFSAVYLWGHLDPDAEAEFLRIRHTQGEIRVSENHLVFVVRREEGGVGGAIPAGRVRAGDLLEYVSVDVVESVEVLSVSRVNEMGVYSPFTLTSRIVVDGVVCSVFAVPEVTVGDTSKAHNRGHILMAPLRFGVKTGLLKCVSYQMSGKMHIYCSALEKMYYIFRPIETLFQ